MESIAETFQADRDVPSLVIIAACVRDFDANLFCVAKTDDETTVAFDVLLGVHHESTPRLLDKRPVFLTSYAPFRTTMARADVERVGG